MGIKISMTPPYQICVDRWEKGNMQGRLYCGCLPEGDPFFGIEDLLLMMDSIMDGVGFPRSTFEKRSFAKDGGGNGIFISKNRGMLVKMRKFEADREKGKKATFIIEVQFRQNASWQGTITWVEKQQRMCFRSTLEMIRLIDSTMEEGCQVEVLDSPQIANI